MVFIIIFASTYYSDTLVQNEISDVKALVGELKSPVIQDDYLPTVREKINTLESNRKAAYNVFLGASILLLFLALYALYYKADSCNLPSWLRFKKCLPKPPAYQNNPLETEIQGSETPPIPQEVNEPVPPVKEMVQKEDSKKKYANSLLTENQAKHHLDRLLKYMEDEKPYLESDLTVRTLARKLSMPQKELSQVINDCLDMNFWKFVNEYRVQEARQLLLDSKSSKRSILEIAYDAGFNSKSSFNEVFKKQLNMTPSKFKQAHAAG